MPDPDPFVPRKRKENPRAETFEAPLRIPVGAPRLIINNLIIKLTTTSFKKCATY